MSEMEMDSSITQATAEIEAYDPLVVVAAERERRLRRFNWLTVYLPLLLVALLALTAWIVLGWVTLFVAAEGPQAQASGIADSLVVLTCLLPLSLVCAALPAGGIYLLYKRQQSGSWVRVRIQDGLRYVNNLLLRGESGVNTGESYVKSYVGSAAGRLNRSLDAIDRLAAKVRAFVERRLGG